MQLKQLFVKREVENQVQITVGPKLNFTQKNKENKKCKHPNETNILYEER